jgi:putative hydrolase of the HAD superfamily
VTDAPQALLLDAGGVLVTPPFPRHHDLVADRMSAEDVRRAFYAAYAESHMPIEGGRDSLWSNYARRLGVDLSVFSDTPALMGWTEATPDAATTITAVTALGIPVVVVSNAAGDVADLLAGAAVAHVGPSGPGPEITEILDSGDTDRYPDERLSRKPLPRMLHDAMALLGLEPAEVLFVGDALWSDALAAYRAGVPFLHIDPFGDCGKATVVIEGPTLPSAGHDHITTLADALPFVVGERPRRPVALHS